MPIMKPELVQETTESTPRASQTRRTRKPERDMVSVYRLAEYDETLSAEQQPEREFIGTFPFDSDYEGAIKKLSGAGHYRIEQRRGGRFVSYHEAHIDEPPQAFEPDMDDESGVDDYDLDERIAAAVAVALAADRRAQERERIAPAQATPPPSPPRAADPVRDAMRLIKDFKELGAELMPSAPPVTVTAKASEPLTTEQALLHLISQDEGALDDVRAKLLNTERGEGWAETIRTAVKTVTSDLPGILALLGVTGQKPAQVVHPTPHAPRAVAPPVPSEQIEAGDEGDAMSYEEMLGQLLVNLATNEPPMESVGMFREVASANPEYAPMIAGMMYLPIDDLMAQIQKLPALAATEQIPHAKKWFEGLQQALREGQPS